MRTSKVFLSFILTLGACDIGDEDYVPLPPTQEEAPAPQPQPLPENGVFNGPAKNQTHPEAPDGCHVHVRRKDNGCFKLRWDCCDHTDASDIVLFTNDKSEAQALEDHYNSLFSGLCHLEEE